MDPLSGGLLGLQRRQLFTLYMLIGGVLIVLAVTAYTLHIVRSVERQSRLTTELFSGMASRLLLAGDDLREAGKVIGILNEIEVPFIITDSAGRPMLWNRVTGVRQVDDYAALRAENPRSPSIPEVRQVLRLAFDLDQANEPYAIFGPDGARVGTVHYGTSALSKQIQIMPYLELAIMVLFFLVILWGLQVKKENDQNLLFAGMAKETAHQLGTPLTSILGWLALLQERLGPDDTVMAELDRDVDRLGKVSARFSQIGSKPRLDDHDLMGVIADTVTYFSRRLPHLGGRVELHSEGAVSNRVQFNRDLMEWVLENLIKNGIDALKDGKGSVVVRMADVPEGGVIVRVVDTGGGIPPRARAKVFEPGFTTKKRGWGMGLALVKRIVTQYHNGRIRVESTGPHGTTFAITLPGEEA